MKRNYGVTDHLDSGESQRFVVSNFEQSVSQTLSGAAGSAFFAIRSRPLRPRRRLHVIYGRGGDARSACRATARA